MKTKKIIIGELFILFVILTIFVITNHITYFDTIVYQEVISMRSDLLDTFFKGITRFANTITVLCVLIVCMLKMDPKNRNMIGITMLITMILNQAIKLLVRRPRPTVLRLIQQNGFSFPSGHAMASIALYGFLIYYVYQNTKNKYWKVFLMTALTLLIIGIGLSRIYLGVHYPSDVLAGFSLALVVLIGTIDWYHKNMKGE